MNRIEGLGILLAGRAPPPPGGSGNRLGPGGEINCAGDPGATRAFLSLPGEADFWQNIEPGVQPLVRVLVADLGWLTYTSCAGHPGAPLRERHVGLLVRSDAEGAQIVSRLGAACVAANAGETGATLELSLLAADTELGPWPCLDLVFRARAPGDAYLAAANRLQARLLDALMTAGPVSSRPPTSAEEFV